MSKPTLYQMVARAHDGHVRALRAVIAGRDPYAFCRTDGEILGVKRSLETLTRWGLVSRNGVSPLAGEFIGGVERSNRRHAARAEELETARLEREFESELLRREADLEQVLDAREYGE